MTTPSLHESTGIIVQVNTPLVSGGGWIGNLTYYDSYSHVIAANGGYESISIMHKFDLNDLEDWFENGLGRHIVVYNHAQQIICEGFVNNVSINAGVLRATRGPLMDITNRTWANFVPLNTAVLPPTRGTKTTTVAVQDTDSQAKYGIVERVLNAGETTNALAIQLCDTHLAEYAEPETLHEIGDQGEPSVTIDCLGYHYWLDAVRYSETGASGTVQISDPTGATGKLQLAIIAANAINSWSITTDYTHMEANALLAQNYENDDKTCKNVIDENVALGNSSDQRMTFGLYANRIPYYATVPTSFEYQEKILTNEAAIETLYGSTVYPWDVLPARWIMLSDFLVGRPLPIIVGSDPRAVFIESVTYTAPYGLSITSGKVNTVPQLLAKLGTGGRTV